MSWHGRYALEAPGGSCPKFAYKFWTNSLGVAAPVSARNALGPPQQRTGANAGSICIDNPPMRDTTAKDDHPRLSRITNVRAQ